MPFVSESRYTTQIGWDEAVHLTRKQKADMLRATPPHLRAARRTGAPVLGVGRIYPLDIEELYDPPGLAIPDWWPRVFGLDVGWNWTVAVWGAWDRDADCVHLYSEYFGRQKPPILHAQALKSRGEWIPGVIDPAAQQRSQKDGERIIESYWGNGVQLEPAVAAPESGIQECLERMTEGRLKIGRHLVGTAFEFSIYRRDEKGKIVKTMDHGMDGMRYLVQSGLPIARTKREMDRTGWVQPGVADRRAGF